MREVKGQTLRSRARKRGVSAMWKGWAAVSVLAALLFSQAAQGAHMFDPAILQPIYDNVLSQRATDHSHEYRINGQPSMGVRFSQANADFYRVGGHCMHGHCQQVLFETILFRVPVHTTEIL